MVRVANVVDEELLSNAVRLAFQCGHVGRR